MFPTTLVVPCYNEARRLQADAFLAALEALPALSLLFVDDGSTDGTGALLQDLCAGHPRASWTRMPENQGKGEAVRHGMLAALAEGAEVTGYWDADLATPLGEVPRLSEALTDPEVLLVMGARVRMLGRHIRRRTLRHYAGRIFATAASLSLGVPVYDTQCGAKLLRSSDPVRQALAIPFDTRWVFDVQLMARLIAARGPACVREVPLNDWQDVAGSKLTARAALRGAIDLVRMRRDLREARTNGRDGDEVRP